MGLLEDIVQVGLSLWTHAPVTSSSRMEMYPNCVAQYLCTLSTDIELTIFSHMAMTTFYYFIT